MEIKGLIMKMKILAGLSVIAMLMLSGCAAMSTAITHRNLDVQSQMTNTIFLLPLADNQKIIYVQVSNTSDQQGINIQSELLADLEARGYKITTDMNKAQLILQVNLLQVGQVIYPAESTQNSLENGAITGASAGLSLAGMGASGNGSIAAGWLVGIGSVAADSLISDVTYAMITDVQISTHLAPGMSVSQNISSNIQQGSSTNVKSTINGSTQWQTYQTRIISHADKVNLKFTEAEPQIASSLAQSIANIFP
jgi:hypothetical protein